MEAMKSQHIGWKNLALGKKCGQSSVYGSYTCDKAVDGDRDSFSHSTHSSFPYWWVDLGNNNRINRIDIYNRKGCCALELKIAKLENQMEAMKSQHIGWKNLALGKKCGQSSVYGSYTCDKAVDGDRDSFSHSTHSSFPYWWVDLGNNNRINRIDIYNRKGCCGERLHDLEVKVGKSMSTLKLCGFFKGPANNGEHVVITCKEKFEARFVKLMIMEKNPVNTYLHVADVEVYA
ncbi:unnamed protein product [Mytilus coruscus]|uniref:Fucolectin tachylectin-4 pentraxin-1 domain-containing protein n=1 Tax=Mytilus coruscus TaxID=42192 RepID=A0A6J7ZZI3_MYTCO|nr:unnamed protein product [Mytilus coruscus]